MKTITKVYMSIVGVAGIVLPLLIPALGQYVHNNPDKTLAVLALTIITALWHDPIKKA